MLRKRTRAVGSLSPPLPAAAAAAAPTLPRSHAPTLPRSHAPTLPPTAPAVAAIANSTAHEVLRARIVELGGNALLVHMLQQIEKGELGDKTAKCARTAIGRLSEKGVCARAVVVRARARARARKSRRSSSVHVRFALGLRSVRASFTSTVHHTRTHSSITVDSSALWEGDHIYRIGAHCAGMHHEDGVVNPGGGAEKELQVNVEI